MVRKNPERNGLAMARTTLTSKGQITVIMLLLRSDEVTVEGHRVVRDALYLFRSSKADSSDCLIGLSNGLAGCERTATFDRGAARLDEFELI
jgi:predicted nucleic-acid-binding protein